VRRADALCCASNGDGRLDVCAARPMAATDK